MIAGTVMNGPVPTIFDMLMETAFRSPSCRGRGTGAEAGWADRVLAWELNRNHPTYDATVAASRSLTTPRKYCKLAAMLCAGGIAVAPNFTSCSTTIQPE